MKWTLSSICILAVLGFARPGLATDVESSASINEPLNDTNTTIIATTNQTMNATNKFQVLSRLLHIEETTMNQEQKNMIFRILEDEDKSTCKDIKMLCQIDSLLRNVTQDLITDGVTNVSQEIDMQKFDALFSRLLSTVDKNVLQAYFLGANQNSDELYFWEEQGPEFQAFMKLTLELESLIEHHDAFFPSSIVSPFIISDLDLRKEAIQKLLDGPSFQLKPLSKQGKFYEFKNRINSQIQSFTTTDMNAPVLEQQQTITIPLDKVLGYNFVSTASGPQVKGTDMANSTDDMGTGNTELEKELEAEEVIVMNVILRGLLGDLLGVILDLPGQLLGGGNGSGLTITIGIGGGGGKKGNTNGDYDGDYDEPAPRRNPPPITTARRRAPTTTAPGRRQT